MNEKIKKNYYVFPCYDAPLMSTWMYKRNK